jgi:hypothetical protein
MSRLIVGGLADCILTARSFFLFQLTRRMVIDWMLGSWALQGRKVGLTIP